jgi:hypothetical protein
VVQIASAERQLHPKAGLSAEREAEVLAAWKKKKGRDIALAMSRTPQRGGPYRMRNLFARIVDVKPNELHALLPGVRFQLCRSRRVLRH